VQRVVELSLELPFELRMLEVSRVQFERVGVHGSEAVLELNIDFHALALGARRESQQGMVIQLQLPKNALQPRIGFASHTADCNRLLQLSARGALTRGDFPGLCRCITLECLHQDLKTWVDRLRSGDPRALARAISTVENRSPGRSDLLKALFPFSGHARLLGLTGAPGAGKSTLVDQLARLYRKSGQTLGIIAVDPTSPYTGGAILGDRIRMQEHHADPGIYIRSMATRGSLGGLARTTADVATVLDASGRDLILIETVGVGQDEVDIVRLADITIVILVPGMGDDVQSIKAGIMEIADIFVVNKSDRDGAEHLEREIRALQSLATRSDGWIPPIVKTIATTGAGVAELAESIRSFEEHLRQEKLGLRRNIQNWQERLIEMLRDAMLDKAQVQMQNGRVEQYAAEIAEHKRDPYTLVEEIVRGNAAGVPALPLGVKKG